ncbi:MAG: methyltransferase domain-containing protein [Alphaproteobacteria bacterium]|nr:MAG: methyltransferase domain-containing protein [Alphaproteobacteria bacterium]
MILFDRSLIRSRRKRCAAYCHHDPFVHHEAEARLMDRIMCINKHFERVVIIGATSTEWRNLPNIGTCIFADLVAERLPHDSSLRILCDEEWLPFAPNSLDAIISILTLHHLNDCVGALIQMRHALIPDGLMSCVTYGARSLHELRIALIHAEMQRTGGITPRISPFMEVRDAGALLQRTGYALPVIDSDLLDISYPSLHALLHELRQSGEQNALIERSKYFTAPQLFMDASQYYHEHFSDAEDRLHATIELLFMSGWNPHHTQQQPSRRGSGTQSLRTLLAE